MKERIAQFFDNYAARFNAVLKGAEPDVAATCACFAGCFVSSGPAGVQCGNNDERFRESIPQRFAFYKSIGMESMNIGSRVITQLDDMHAMVKIHWQSRYVKQEGNRVEIGFDNHYFVQVRNENVKIFAYTTGDEQQALAEKGLEPYR